MDWAKRLEKLLKLIQLITLRVSIVITHRDPDSISAAKGMKKLFEFFGKSVDIYYCYRKDDQGNEEIFPQTQAIINEFRLDDDFMPIELFTDEKQKDAFIVVVDAPTLNNSRLNIPVKSKPRITVDHHYQPAECGEKEDDESWYWFEPLGAAASMVAKLLFDLKVPFSKPDAVATLLMIGIKNDTAETNSLDMSTLDYQMLAELSKYHEQKQIYEIATQAVSEGFWELAAIAGKKENQRKHGTVFIASVGDITPDNEPDHLRIVRMMQATEGVKTSHAWGLSGRYLIIKSRNDNKEVDLNKVLAVFGEVNGGSKANAGGIVMDLGPIGETKNRAAFHEAVWRWLEEKLIH